MIDAQRATAAQLGVELMVDGVSTKGNERLGKAMDVFAELSDKPESFDPESIKEGGALFSQWSEVLNTIAPEEDESESRTGALAAQNRALLSESPKLVMEMSRVAKSAIETKAPLADTMRRLHSAFQYLKADNLANMLTDTYGVGRIRDLVSTE